MWQLILKACRARGYTGDDTLDAVQAWLAAQPKTLEFTDPATGKTADIAKAFADRDTKAKAVEAVTLDAEDDDDTTVKVDQAELNRLKAIETREKQRKAAARVTAVEADIHASGGDDSESSWLKSISNPETFRIRQERKAYNAKSIGAHRGEPSAKSARVFQDYDQAVGFNAWFKCNVLGRFNVASRDEKKMWDDIQAKTAITTTNTLGGALVPDIFVPELINLKETYGVARQWIGVTMMTNQSETRPRRTGGYTVYTAAEGASLTASDLGFNNIRLDAKKLYCYGTMSSEMLRYSSVNLADYAANEITYAFANKEDEIVFNGDGTDTYFGWTGFRVALKNVYSTTAGVGQSLASGNLFSEYAAGDFTSAIGKVPKYADTPRAAWVCHKATDAQTMMRLQSTAGGETGAALATGYANRRFLNYGVLHAQVMPSTDVNSQIAHLIGDASLASHFGEVTGSMRIDINDSVGFATDTIAIRGCEEIAFTLHDPGTSSVAGPVISVISAAS